MTTLTDEERAIHAKLGHTEEQVAAISKRNARNDEIVEQLHVADTAVNAMSGEYMLVREIANKFNSKDGCALHLLEASVLPKIEASLHDIEVLLSTLHHNTIGKQAVDTIRKCMYNSYH